jgi:hypothetical protein
MIRMPKMFISALALVFLLSLTVSALGAEAKGKVKSVNGDKNMFVIADENSKDLTITLAKDGKVFINDKEEKLSNLQAGDEVTVTHEKKGEALIASEVRCTRK